MTTQIPKTIGRYRVDGLLGRGGMATVFKAHDTSVGRDVALKLLSTKYLHNAIYKTRFNQEARTIASLEHPAIVPLYDFGESDGRPYLVMRLMPGGTLAQKLMREGAFAPETLLTLLRHIAPALDFAHDQGILHRDLKPANILLDQFGNPFLTDFGVAKILTDHATLTKTGETIGTPAYMSPEMIKGRPLTTQSDIYALGIIVYKLLTGQNPYRSNDPIEVAQQHLSAPIPDLPSSLTTLHPPLSTALAKSPTDRYPTATAFHNALAHAIHPPEKITRHLITKNHTPSAPLPSPTRQEAVTDDPTIEISEIDTIEVSEIGTIEVSEIDVPTDELTPPASEILQTMTLSLPQSPGQAPKPSDQREPLSTFHLVSEATLSPIDALSAKANREILACIGCNDCLIACPLPETAFVSIAELNFAVSQPVVSAPNVIDFVSACTQCQQCVPVCPADLSRADMVLWNKLKVEDATPDQPLLFQTAGEVESSPWTSASLADHLTQLPLFSGIKPQDLRRTITKSTLRKAAPSEKLTTAGEYHERLTVVIEGAIEQISESTRILVLGPGSFIGEMAVMADRAEPFTVRTLDDGDTILLEIPKTAVYQLMQLSPAFQDTMNALYADGAIGELRRADVLKGIETAVLDEIVREAELITYPAHTPIPDDAFYIVRNGFLRVADEDRVLIYFRTGDSFGLSKILQNEPSPYAITTSTRAELFRVTGDELRTILNTHPATKSKLLRRTNSSLSTLATDRSPQSPPSRDQRKPLTTNHQPLNTILDLSYTQLLDQGVLQSHELLVIDQAICTDCNNCVDACGRRHGVSRLDRSGLQLGNLLFPTACRHCEDPVCLLCSVNGIIREPNGEISIIDDNCIGCGACADRCPYDNIQMHPKDAPPPRSRWGGLWDLILGREPEEVTLDPDTPQIAVKCNLCAGHGDYACVTACPVGAAYRIDPVKSFDISNMILGLVDDFES